MDGMCGRKRRLPLESRRDPRHKAEAGSASRLYPPQNLAPSRVKKSRFSHQKTVVPSILARETLENRPDYDAACPIDLARRGEVVGQGQRQDDNVERGTFVDLLFHSRRQVESEDKLVAGRLLELRAEFFEDRLHPVDA